ncbi:50S ribosomal protein L23 [Candidatus Micrarchaeota archaeon]|nr:50S ribosomal protein L23 [Candidatus Micrarchaeota archaeon]
MESLKYLISTEKAVGLMEIQNTLIFVVKKDATKKQIKKDIEETYGVKIDKINILNSIKGEKKAFVKLNEQFRADDIAAKLKMI